MSKTLFQKIADGEIPGDFVHQDEHCIAIRDINPVAPIHILVIPRKVILGISSMEDGDTELIGHLFKTARDLAKAEGLGEGFRLVFNDGKNGGQEVPHLHLHVIGGRTMNWPPG